VVDDDVLFVYSCDTCLVLTQVKMRACQQLEEAALPDVYQVVASFPQTPNGKVSIALVSEAKLML
jgi:hypothetical protein